MKNYNKALKENQERTRYRDNLRKEKARQEKARQERQNKKEFILFIFISIFILTITSIYLYNLNDSNYKNCMEKNNNKNMCMEVYE